MIRTGSGRERLRRRRPRFQGIILEPWDLLFSPLGLVWDSDWEAGNRTEPPIDDGNATRFPLDTYCGGSRRSAREPGSGIGEDSLARSGPLDFQTRQHPPARTISLLLSVMIRSLQGTNLHLCIRIRTDSDA